MNLLLPIISGLCLTASFPPFSISYISFISLVPLFFSIQNKSTKDAFKQGYLAGLVHYLTLLYWIPYPITRYGNMSLYASMVPYLLLCGYLSLFPATFCWLCRSKVDRHAIITYPAYWIITEFVRSKILTGFPWCLLGYSQYKNIHIIQIADVTGVYGLSYLIMMINVSIYHVLKRRISKIELVFVGVTLLFVYGYGAYKLNKHIKGKEIKTAIIQGNIDQSIKWNPSYQRKTIEIYLELTRSCYPYKPKLIIWPETAMPFFFQDNGVFANMILKVPKESGASLLFGSPAYSIHGKKIKYYNRAYFISYGHTPIFYDKVHLVPFGEYVPLKRILFFLHRLVPGAGDFYPGHSIRPLRISNISIGPMICFEAIFPEIARTHVKKGANVLVNITNDAWFGRTSAPYQHLIMSVFRAVENRRALIRAANTGISAFIDPYGRIIKKSHLFKREILLSKISLINDHKSFYTCYGNIFLYAIFLMIGGRLWQKLKGLL